MVYIKHLPIPNRVIYGNIKLWRRNQNSLVSDIIKKLCGGAWSHAEKERKMKHKVIAGVTGIMFNVMLELCASLSVG